MRTNGSNQRRRAVTGSDYVRWWYYWRLGHACGQTASLLVVTLVDRVVGREGELFHSSFYFSPGGRGGGGILYF